MRFEGLNWRSIADDPPKAEDHVSILVFPLVSDVGHMYNVSNVPYVLGPHNKYTHWAIINKAPTHDYWEYYCDNIPPYDGKRIK